MHYVGLGTWVGDIMTIGTYQHPALWSLIVGKRMRKVALGILPWWDFVAG